MDRVLYRILSWGGGGGGGGGVGNGDILIFHLIHRNFCECFTINPTGHIQLRSRRQLSYMHIYMYIILLPKSFGKEVGISQGFPPPLYETLVDSYPQKVPHFTGSW